ncbi:MAG: hypothetical protein AB1505_26560 [Candidatus Latescibacterota bacterium]
MVGLGEDTGWTYRATGAETLTLPLTDSLIEFPVDHRLAPSDPYSPTDPYTQADPCRSCAILADTLPLFYSISLSGIGTDTSSGAQVYVDQE